jgi:hypothetical protein
MPKLVGHQAHEHDADAEHRIEHGVVEVQAKQEQNGDQKERAGLDGDGKAEQIESHARGYRALTRAATIATGPNRSSRSCSTPSCS